MAAGLADKCEVQLAYAIGVAEPVSILVETFGTAKVDPAIHPRPGARQLPAHAQGIIDSLNLRRPIYRKTAAYGHFGRNDKDFTWEATDKAAKLASDAGLREPALQAQNAEFALQQIGDARPRPLRIPAVSRDFHIPGSCMLMFSTLTRHSHSGRHHQ